MAAHSVMAPPPVIPRAPYALRVVGGSMIPRVKARELILADPEIPVGPGDEVLIACVNGGRTMRRFLRRRNGVWYFGGYGRACGDLKLRDVDVAAVHFVAGVLPAIYSPDRAGGVTS